MKYKYGSTKKCSLNINIKVVRVEKESYDNIYKYQKSI